jgi:hypothetical protein
VTDVRAQAKSWAEVLVTVGESAERYVEASYELLRLLKTLVPIEPYAKDHPLWTNVHIRSGLVVAPGYAQNSIGSGVYLAMFAQALDALVARHREQGSRRPLRVLYPACGPFFGAGLVVSLLRPAEDVQLTLVDVSSASLQMAQIAAAQLGLEAHVEAFVHADASRWTPDATYDVLLVSCLTSGLSDEPQVAVASNLVPFLEPDGVLLPEAVEVGFACFHLAGMGSEELPDQPGGAVTFEPIPETSRTLMRVDRPWLLALGRPEQRQAHVIELEDLRADEPWPSGSVPGVWLRVEVAEGSILPAGSIGATIPRARPDLLDASHRHWKCHYALEHQPGVVFTQVRTDPF